MVCGSLPKRLILVALLFNMPLLTHHSLFILFCLFSSAQLISNFGHLISVLYDLL